MEETHPFPLHPYEKKSSVHHWLELGSFIPKLGKDILRPFFFFS